MTDTTTAGEILVQDTLGRVRTPREKREQILEVKFPRFSGQAGRRGSGKDVHYAEDPSDLRQRLPSRSRQPPDQQPVPSKAVAAELGVSANSLRT